MSRRKGQEYGNKLTGKGDLSSSHSDLHIIPYNRFWGEPDQWLETRKYCLLFLDYLNFIFILMGRISFCSRGSLCMIRLSTVGQMQDLAQHCGLLFKFWFWALGQSTELDSNWIQLYPLGYLSTCTWMCIHMHVTVYYSHGYVSYYHSWAEDC